MSSSPYFHNDVHPSSSSSFREIDIDIDGILNPKKSKTNDSTFNDSNTLENNDLSPEEMVKAAVLQAAAAECTGTSTTNDNHQHDAFDFDYNSLSKVQQQIVHVNNNNKHSHSDFSLSKLKHSSSSLSKEEQDRIKLLRAWDKLINIHSGSTTVSASESEVDDEEAQNCSSLDMIHHDIDGEGDKSRSSNEVASDENITVQDTMDLTISVFTNHIQDLIKKGTKAYDNIQKQTMNIQKQNFIDKNQKEQITRLQNQNQAYREQISSQLKIIEQNKLDTLDTLRDLSIQSKLKKEMTIMKAEKEKLEKEGAYQKKRIMLQKEEIDLLKMKLNRILTEKLKMERDSRNAMSFSLNNSNSNSSSNSEVEYFKKRTKDLNGRLLKQQEEIFEKDKEIDDLRRKVHRNASQNQLMQMQKAQAEKKLLKRRRVSS